MTSCCCPVHRLYPVGISVDRQVNSDLVLQNYHIPAGVSEAPSFPGQAGTCTRPADRPPAAADADHRATLLPGPKPRRVREARALPAAALAAPRLRRQAAPPGLRLRPPTVPGPAPGRDGDAAAAAPRERPGRGRGLWAGPEGGDRGLTGRRGPASVLGAETLPGGHAHARGYQDGLPFRPDAVRHPAADLPGPQLVPSPHPAPPRLQLPSARPQAPRASTGPAP